MYEFAQHRVPARQAALHKAAAVRIVRQGRLVCDRVRRGPDPAAAWRQRSARDRSRVSRRSSSLLRWLFRGSCGLGGRCWCRRRQARQYLLRQQANALLGLSVVEKPRASDKDEMAKSADLLVNVHDLLIDGIRATGAENPTGDRLLGGDADQALARA